MMSEYVNDCISVMADEGLSPESNMVDFSGALKRYRIRGDKKSGKHG